MPFFDDIRYKNKSIAVSRQSFNTIAILFLGIVLGVFSKFLDTTARNELPYILEHLDVTNFLGRFAIWILIAVCVSIFSNSPLRASINVFMFFIGMVSSYYLYSKFVAGFFPSSYAMIWFGFTTLSPLLASICWYAKGESNLAFILSVMIIAVLFNMTFTYGWIYFDMRSILELIVFICGLIVLKRNSIKESIAMLIIGIVLAFVLNWIIPFHFG
ncbi:hypothetical protein [Clostridium sp. D53t1_180928_C8]|uniref:hypothetical protein n=1 Tax=Clostridium sp. D53t1_180928_C8 TaxID=2787101 RepID=UPI0018A97C12|nr:hypothetical protein [Clostridium sp. D53t1_180928_C8]